MTRSTPSRACRTCGQTHTGCTAHNRSGNPCKAIPLRDMTVCHLHGGKSPRALAAREVRDRTAQARVDVARFAARVDIDPAAALLDLVHYQAGVVAYWRDRVEEVEAAELEWSLTQVTTGPEGGDTYNAGGHVAYRLLMEAQGHLAQYAAAALRAGVEERRVQLAEDQGRMVASALREVLDRLSLSAEQEALVPSLMPGMLRAIAGGAA